MRRSRIKLEDRRWQRQHIKGKRSRVAWRGSSQLEELQERRCGDGDGNEAGTLRVRVPLKDRKSQGQKEPYYILEQGKGEMMWWVLVITTTTIIIFTNLD